jgi:hypothetical protein
MSEIHRVKFLADQLTGQVVWFTNYFDSQPIPVFDQSLNTYKYRGPSNLALWNMYLSFKLFYNSSTGELYSINEYSQNFKEQFPRIYLLRAKAIALDHVNVAINILQEKFDIAFAGIHNVAKSENILQPRWINFFKQEHNCSAEDAIKLINFKKEEWNNLEFKLESTRYQMYNRIKLLETFDQVNDLYRCICTKLFYSGPKLANVPALQLPF